MNPDLPILDPEPLRCLYELPGGPESVQELVQIFAEDVPERIAALRAAVASGLAREAGVEAHSLKGGAGNMGLVRLADVAKALEHLLRDEGDLACETLMEELDQAFPPALAALRETFPAPKS